MTFLVVNFMLFFCDVLSWDRHLLFHCSLKWDLCWYISGGRLFRWWLLWWWALLLLLEWWELTFIYFILCLLFFHLNVFFSWFIFVVLILLILLILFVNIFPSILIVFFITFDISTDLNELDFTFMDSRINIVDLDFTWNRVTLYPSTRTFSSLIADIDAFMHDSLLFLLLRLW